MFRSCRKKSKKKPWRTFKNKECGRERQICWWIRRSCGIILVIEAVVLWMQAGLPAVQVERQQQTWLEKNDQARQESDSILEQIFGVRLRLEDGVVEFYRKEEVKNIH